MNSLVAKYLFLAVEWLRREHVGKFLNELLQNQQLSPSQLAELQENKRRELLNFVENRNGYFRKKYRGFDAISDFESLPLMTKEELREQFQDIVTPDMKSRVYAVKTSGSTGIPLKFYRDKLIFGYTLASVYRGHSWHGLDVGAKEAMLWGIPMGLKNRLLARGRDLLLNRFRETEYSLNPKVLELFYRAILKKKPAYIFGYSSMVYEFALFVRERNYKAEEMGIRAAICTAESIPEYQRELIEDVFGCQVVSEYGSAETGIISYECKEGSHHISSDCVLVELLDANGKRVPSGEIGKVIVTVLNSFAAPIIRYDLGDLAIMSEESCDCGINLPILKKIIGRSAGIIVTPGGQCFHSIVIYYLMKEFSEKFGQVRQFRVVQRSVETLDMHIVTTGALSKESISWLKNKSATQFGESLNLNVIECQALVRKPSGKLTDFESALDVSKILEKSFSLS